MYVLYALFHSEDHQPHEMSSSDIDSAPLFMQKLKAAGLEPLADIFVALGMTTMHDLVLLFVVDRCVSHHGTLHSILAFSGV